MNTKSKLLKSIFISLILVMGVNNVSAVDLYLRGIHTWDAKDQTKMTQSGSTYSVVTYLSTIEYSFKIADSNWQYNSNYEANNSNATVQLDSEYSTWHSGGKGDMKFKPSTAGFYKFSLTGDKLTISKYNPSPEEAPNDVVNGTNVMFYIQGYSDNGYNVLRANNSNNISSNSHGLSKIDYSISYVNTKKTNLSTNYYISNNPGEWNGKSYADIKNAQGGELFEAQDSNNKTNAKTATTTTSVANTTLNISTTTNSKTGVCNGTLYIQYYINNNFTGVTYNSSTASYTSISANGATARQSTLDISDYANGTYTLKTILTDGIIYYIADTDEFTVNNAKRHDVTISYLYNSTSIKPSTTESVSESTASEITAPAIDGYEFSSWTLGTGIVNKSANTTVNPISITTNSTGSGYTLIANYEEDLSTEWSLAHSIDNFNTSSHKFTKNTGESAGKVAYVSLDLADNKEYQFKVVNGGTWYGNNNSDEQYWIKQTVENWTFEAGNNFGNCHMKSSVAGTYTFKIDFSGSNPKVSVYFPIAYKVTYGVGNNKGTDAVTTSPSITSGASVLASTEITFSKGATKAGYTWKNWNSKADGTGTNLGTGDTYVSSNRTGDISVYACYDLITYNITYNTNDGTNPNDAPTSYNVITATFDLPTPTKTGYTFAGWYTTSDFSGSKVTQIANGSTGDKTFYAQWTANTYSITYYPNGGTNPDEAPTSYTIESNNITLPTPGKMGYTFDGWFDNEAYNGEAITSIETGSYDDKKYYAKWKERVLYINANWLAYEPYYWNMQLVQDTDNEAVYTHTHIMAVNQDNDDLVDYYFDFKESDLETHAYEYDNVNISYDANYIESVRKYDENEPAIQFGLTRKSDVTITLTLQDNLDKTKPNVTINVNPYYIISFDNTGQNGSAITPSVEAKVGDVLPTATSLPTPHNGYAFMGYFDQKDGKGTQYYKADGTSARTWDKIDNTTLYAYFQKAEITGIAFDKGEVPEGGYVTFEPTIEPTPSGNTVICWELKKGETTIDNSYIIPVEETNNVKISIAELVADKGKGIYTIKATLRTGTGCESGTELSSFETNFATTDFILSTPIYLKPSATWQQHDARFAVYYWGNGENNNGWVDMTTIGCSDEYYAAEIPIGYSDFKFVRLKPSTESGYDSNNNGLNFANAWNQTGNLSVQDGKHLYDLTLTPKKHIYLKPNDTWKSDNAWFAAYFYGNGNTWKKMEHHSDGVYGCDWPSGYTNVIFVRMNKSNTNTLAFSNAWNQTVDLSYYEDCNMFANTDDKEGEKYKGSWSYFYDDCYWSTLDLPTITITNNNPTCGSISVKTIDGTEIASGTKVDWDTQVIVSVQPKAGYAVKSSSINIGGTTETIQPGKTYTICGNTTINISFEEKGEWYLAGEMNNWEIKDEYKLVDGKILVELDGKETKEFKVVKKTGDDTEWYGNFTFKGLHPSGVLNTNSGDYSNCKVETVHDGDYLFVWDENTKMLTIEYPNVIFLHGDFNDWKDKASHALHDRDAKVYLTKGKTYKFKVVEKGIYYTSKDTKQLLTQITMDDPTENADDCTFNASVTGLYTFHFDKETRVLTVTYPEDNTLAVGDYRLQYTNGTNSYYTDHVKKRTSGDGVDTVSLFILNAGTTPRVILQRCTIASGDGTWETVNTYNLSSMTLDNEMIDEHGGVWNFIISQTNNGANATVSNATTPERYTGKYYIRTDAADGGWNEYMIPENEIFFSSYARDNEGFDYYYCKYIGYKTNVKYNIANDYNSKLNPADYTYGTGDLIQSETLPADGNVRFMWNSRTNELVGRAYLDGSTTENFLRITNATNLYDADGKNSINEIKFTDLQNWIYQMDVQANTNTRIKLKAIYNGNEQFFKGDNDNTVPLLTSNNTSKNYKIRLIYNFKTNHLVCAWLGGDETITTDEKLTADMMIIRRDQEQAEQLSFNPNTKQLDLEGTAYAVMTFTKAFIQNETYKERQRSLYWVSFPFDVKISDVFGFGEYGEHWILQYYDGAERAEKGLFIDSGTYWKYITNTETILKKGVGYVLALDLNKVQFLHGVEYVSLYFPSTGEIGIIKGDGETTTMEVPAHQCTITHGQMDRTIYDSHWNLIGIPGFTDPGMIDVTNYNVFLKEYANLGFHYEFDLATNTYNVERSTVAFKTMYSYLVQYHGTMEWNISAIDNTPAQIAARRNSNCNVPEKVSLRLEIAQNEQMIDQTFVQLQQEKATAEFDINLDLTKIINSGANIYTLAGTNRIQTAGNTLPMNNATVPVGVVISKAGEYTFRMPDGTDGILVELIDYETNTTTNLLYDEYTVNLTKGTFENRFALFVRPNNTATSLENINGESTTNGKDVRKVLIDNILYIVRDGQMFDARGARVK